MIAAASSFAAMTGQPELRGVAAEEVANVAKTRALDLRLSEEFGNQRPIPLLRGMIVRHNFAPNAMIGLGLSNIYAKRKVGSEARTDGRTSRSRKPAITFVLKF
jgi:hypothetical protein